MDKDAVAFYLNSAGRVPLLTAVEEIELGRKVQAMMHLLEANPDGPYDMSEKRILRNGKKAKDRMILANLRLVTVLAKKFSPRCRHLGFEDLLQEGVIGLIRGVEKFDPEKGYKFSTYGYWWIRQGIARAVAQFDRIIRLPSNAMDCLVKTRYFVPRFQAEHGRPPTIEEIADECGVTPQIMEHYLRHNSGTRSLDETCRSDEDRGTSIVDMVPCTGITPWEYAEREDAGGLFKALDMLPPTQQEVIQLRFSLTQEGSDFFPQSQADVARRLGVSRQAVQRHEAKAFERLRAHFIPA